MRNIEKYKTDVDRLVEDGNDLYVALAFESSDKATKDFVNESPENTQRLKDVRKRVPHFSAKYQAWYSESYEIIRQLLPSRLADFEEYYKGTGSRKSITHATYTIKDALNGLRVTEGSRTIADASAAIALMHQQLRIVESVKSKFESSLFDIKTLVHAELLDNEISEARVLLKNGYLRAAGAVAGVSLEAHLKSVCDSHQISYAKSATLAIYNDSLKDVVYDVAEWRRIQHLTDLRNKCDHKKTDEPSEENIRDLLDGTDRIIKSVF